MSRGNLSLSWGPYGGFYLRRHRVCLGWIAFTWVEGLEIDELMDGYACVTETAQVLTTLIRQLDEAAQDARQKLPQTDDRLDEPSGFYGGVYLANTKAATRLRRIVSTLDPTLEPEAEPSDDKLDLRS